MNPKIHEDLIKDIVDGNCIAFVGAGINANANMPTWKELMQQMLTYCRKNGIDRVCEEEKELEQLIEDGKYLIVAQELMERMKGYRFVSFITEALGNHDKQIGGREDTPETHRILAQIPFAAILTTNFDNLLYYSLQRELGRGFQPYTYKNVIRPILANKAREFYMLNTHGDLSDPDSIVLTRDGFRSVTFNNRANRSFLSALLLTKSFLFIGFSISDPDLLHLLEELREVFGEAWGGHYAILPASQASPIEQRRWYKDFGITIIPYTHSADHHELTDILSNIQSRVSELRTSRTTRIEHALFKNIPDKDYQNRMDAVSTIAKCFMQSGNYRAARILLEANLMASEVKDDILMTAQVYQDFGCLAQDETLYRDATNYLKKSLDLWKRESNDEKAAQVTCILGQVARAQGEYGDARNLVQEALDVFMGLKNTSGCLQAYAELAEIEFYAEDYSNARKHCDKAEITFKGLPDATDKDDDNVFLARLTRGLIAAKNRQHRKAWLLLTGVLQERNSLGDRNWRLAYVLECIAFLNAEKGAYSQAVKLFHAAERYRAVVGNPVPPSKRDLYNRIKESAKTTMGDYSYTNCVYEGDTMTLDEAVELALEPLS